MLIDTINDDSPRLPQLAFNCNVLRTTSLLLPGPNSGVMNRYRIELIFTLVGFQPDVARRSISEAESEILLFNGPRSTDGKFAEN